jgi:hypothetical protein
MKNKQLSEWIVVHEYCATRIIMGGDPYKVEDRIAFIEKTPRVRIGDYTDWKTDYHNWKEGPKGCGGNLEFDGETIYGFYQPSRRWCDEELKKMGYKLK